MFTSMTCSMINNTPYLEPTFTYANACSASLPMRGPASFFELDELDICQRRIAHTRAHIRKCLRHYSTETPMMLQCDGASFMTI